MLAWAISPSFSTRGAANRGHVEKLPEVWRERTVPEHTSDYFQRANLARYNVLS